jgi:hypothetical protein
MADGDHWGSAWLKHVVRISHVPVPWCPYPPRNAPPQPSATPFATAVPLGHSISRSRRLVRASSMSSLPSPDRMVPDGVEREALDLAVGELGRQRKFLTCGADVD